jgi:hypothetical protein
VRRSQAGSSPPFARRQCLHERRNGRGGNGYRNPHAATAGELDLNDAGAV